MLCLTPGLAFSQEEEKDPDGVSNDAPGRPLQMAPASTVVREAFEDYERFRRRGAWERAFKALYTIPEDQGARFVDGEDGFIVSVSRKRRALLAALPPDGRAAYRLFYDAEAKKLLEAADGAGEVAALERVYSSYFATAAGDDAADRLGDRYFELGRFDRAADCWLSILRERPDTDLSPGLVAVKAALALARAGRRSELAEIRRELAGRYAAEEVRVGGEVGKPAEVLARLIDLEAGGGGIGRETGPRALGVALGEEEDAVWRFGFGDSVTAGMTAAELSQWESNPLSAAYPAVAVDGGRLFGNYLGHVFAVDLASGKLLWRSASFHNLEAAAMQEQTRMIDVSRFAVAAADGYVWTIGRDLIDPNYMATFRLTCRRADGGDVVWQSSDLPDYANVDFVGAPLVVGGTVYVAGKGQSTDRQQQGVPRSIVLAIRPGDGEVIWRAEVGNFRQDQNRYYYYGQMNREPQPGLTYRAGAVYIDTQQGVLARLDAETGDLDWGYGYRTEPADSQGRFFFRGYPTQESRTGYGRPLEAGGALLFKGAKSDHVYAIEPDRMALAWKRPIGTTTRLIGAGEGRAIVGGPEVGALDLKSKRLLWATRLPGESLDGRLLVGSDGIWQLTPRGVFEIDPGTGEVRRIFRGMDSGSVGGDLFLTEGLLVAVSNQTITAYPRGGDAKAGGTTDE